CSILQAIYYMLLRGEEYQELGADYLDQLDRERTAKRLLKRLDNLGYDISSVKDRLPAVPATGQPALPRQFVPIPV
ncbi:MAG: IS110 family transposase, partial [Anaerolineae bacterium]|nr:IS110 family transposase [Anaerolineae bacterium]